MNIQSMKGKYIKVECLFPTLTNPSFYRGTLQSEDNEFIEMIDLKEGNKIIRKAFISKIEMLRPEEANLFVEKEGTKMSANLQVKGLDKKLKDFQEKKAKKDMEELDKRLESFKKKPLV